LVERENGALWMGVSIHNFH